VILIAVGRVSLPKSAEEKEADAKRDAKGAAGNTLDFFAGEGTTDAIRKGATNQAAGFARVITDAGLSGYNFITDPFHQRPDLTRAHYDYVRDELKIDPSNLSPAQVHDIVHPTKDSKPFPVRRLVGAMA